MLNNQTISLSRLAEVFKALGNPHRLSLLHRLMDCCPASGCGQTEEEARACVGELSRDLGIAPSTVSHHIKELRRAGLIVLERRGRNVDCRVDPGTLREIVEFLQPGCAGAEEKESDR